MVIPGHLIFAYTISYLQAGHTSFTPVFMVVYLVAAIFQASYSRLSCVTVFSWGYDNMYVESEVFIALLLEIHIVEHDAVSLGD
jgi:hypothetical protein